MLRQYRTDHVSFRPLHYGDNRDDSQRTNRSRLTLGKEAIRNLAICLLMWHNERKRCRGLVWRLGRLSVSPMIWARIYKTH